ncbi:cholesterol oxidase substrate-binding domain-containing protein [Pseudofrankia inefficax]|uniref:Cholesterol oxidase substrate-binding protein n=1 Tax=Pseudofrankia inefficax (strain DSM 45817 / CECT 9037 / DDB 130130 / EuI1c) TaxID=298654 RepID=E3J1G5_PSEI1|nr:cholesterol oxidase substrate-binding domain-containing protein [Pseudofrankia inefficax]ADP80486.1 Cholesterol oxidase substrate-binding protein [Pseudofrankia inefficax]
MGQQQDGIGVEAGNDGADDGGLGGLPGSGPAPGRGGTRRAVLAGAVGAAAVTAAGWTPALGAAAAYADPPAPPNFPAGLSLYRQEFKNWSGEIDVTGVWTCAPASPADVVTLANWAKANNYRIRPRGMGHGWSPLTLAVGSSGNNVILVDTTQHLTAVTISGPSGSTPATVRAQTGVTMDSLLTQLQAAGYGLTANPAPGDLTVGGVLAIDAHGTAVPASGETRVSGTTYGSLSNLITSLTAVVWDPGTTQYVLRTFSRADAASKAFLAHLGRAFLTEVTLQVGANQRLRCQSWFNINWTELFAAPGSSGRTFASYVESAGRVEAIWFPFTDNPWLKVWTRSPNKPLLSRQVSSPYNYSFSDNLPSSITDLVAQISTGAPQLAPTLGQTQIAVVGAGLISTLTYDIWGWSKDLTLYVRPSTLRVTANGYAILTSRANIQRVVNEFCAYYRTKLTTYQNNNQFPMNGPVEIRVTGLDAGGDVQVPSAGSPQLSALRPRPDHPEWDVAVWLDILTVPGTPYANQFYREVEAWVFSNYSGSYAAARPEWSKGWGYTNSAAWADPTMIGTTIPNALRAGQPAGDTWDTALATLDTYDPSRIFSSPLLDTLAP